MKLDAWVLALLMPATLFMGAAHAQTYTKTETIEYYDNSALWVLGQIKKMSVDGVVESETGYGSHAQPLTIRSFGKLIETRTYDVTTAGQLGTVSTVKDGNNNVTTLGGWKRGIPQLIQFADGTSKSAVVNDAGWITSVTDENAYATGYSYDTMGRLASIVPPSGDSTAWNTTTQTFVPVSSSEYGIPAGHWRQTISTGTARKITYFDALWQPLLVREYDTADEAGTERFHRFAYDHDGRVVFASYPSTTSTPTTGTWTDYDALGRVVAVSQDSELGSALVTLTEYLSGHRVRTTSPRGFATLTSYKAYDQPTYDWPVSIAHPEGAYTSIVRDAFGKPVSITRRNSNSSLSVTRSYVYDANQQLCKAVEPETGATLMSYDGAGNLSWSASGQNFPSSTSCDTASVASNQKITRTYDARNRLETLAFPDGRGNQTWSYTPDGLPSQITTNNSNGGDTVVNAYTYNRRRLLTGEAVTQGAATFTLGYGYTANAHLANHIYPTGLTVAYAPNALGHPSRAGSYATGVSYYPNGAIKRFTYGNGIVHTMTQNARQLPARSTDAGGGNPLDLAYAYDANANVVAITDYVGAGRQTRSMTYDGLDRLLTTRSAMFGGDNLASFSYDVLDNLRTFKVGTIRNYTYTYNSKQQLETVSQAVGGAAVVGLSYDVRGNLANKNGVSHEFDYGNRLRQVVGRESYRYDGHGRRVRSASSSLGDIESFYDNGGVLRYQRNARTNEVNEYIYLGGSLIARITSPVVSAPTSPPVLTVPASSTTGAYTASWTVVATASRYELEEQANGGSWTQIQATSATSRAVSGKGSGSYSYRVRACNVGGCTSYSAVKATSVLLPPGAAPSLNAPATSSSGSYTISWSAVNNATNYRLEERKSGGSWAEIYNGTATSAALSGRSNGSYEYRARGCNSSGCSGYSALKSTTVLLPPSAAPTVAVPATSGTGSYVVSWTEVSTATSYRLEQRKDGGSWSEIYNGTARSASRSGVTNGSYAYRARACNSSGCGAYSAVVQVQVTLLVNNAQFVSWVRPASLMRNQTASVTITLKNTGTTTWPANSAYNLGHANDAMTWGTHRRSLGSAVAPGETVSFVFTITAPATVGTYEFRWQMVQDGVEWFGEQTPAGVITVKAVGSGGGGPGNCNPICQEEP